MAWMLPGCSKVPDTPQAPRPQASASLDQPIRIAQGEAIAVAATSLVLTFERVTEDSRCPVNVNCVWAGNAVVQLAARIGGAPRAAIELHTTTSGRREATVDGYRVRLDQLAPVRSEGSPIAQDQYIATITVVRSP